MKFIQKVKLKRKIKALKEAQELLKELDSEMYFLSKQLDKDSNEIQEAIKVYCLER